MFSSIAKVKNIPYDLTHISFYSEYRDTKIHHILLA